MKKLNFKKYIISKDCEFGDEGSVFTIGKDNLYHSYSSTKIGDFTYNASMHISPEVMNKLVATGYAYAPFVFEKAEENIVPACEHKVKLDKVKHECNELIEKYNKLSETALDDYYDGAISQEDKHEAVTVYSNLIKLLEHLKNTINGK